MHLQKIRLQFKNNVLQQSLNQSITSTRCEFPALDEGVAGWCLQAELGANSLFLEGVDFSATAKKDGVVLGDDRRWFFESHIFRVLVADTTPPAIAGTPSTEGDF